MIFLDISLDNALKFASKKTLVIDLENMEEVKWIACAGIIGDKGDKNSEICKKFVDSLDNYEELSLVSDYIFSADLVDNIDGDNKALEIIKNAKLSLLKWNPDII